MKYKNMLARLEAAQKAYDSQNQSYKNSCKRLGSPKHR